MKDQLGIPIVGDDFEVANARTRRSWVMAAAVTALVIAVSAVGAAGLQSRDAEPSIAVPDEGWADVSAAWVSRDAVQFQGASTPRPDTLLSLGSTRDVAFWLTPNEAETGDLTVFDPTTGSVRVVASDVEGLPISDPVGHVLAWSSVGEKSTIFRMRTDTGLIESAEVGGERLRVFALDGTTLYISNGNDVHLKWAGVDSGPVAYKLSSDQEGIVTDAAGDWTLEIGSGGTTLVTPNGDEHLSSQPLFGSFDSTRELVLLAGADVPSVLRIGQSEPLPLRLPEGMIFDSARWTENDLLLLRGAIPRKGLTDIVTSPELPVSDYLCEPTSNVCQQLPDRGLSLGDADGVPASATGQFATIVQ